MNANGGNSLGLGRMPKGVYKRTDETRRKMSESHKGLKLTSATKKN